MREHAAPFLRSTEPVGGMAGRPGIASVRTSMARKISEHSGAGDWPRRCRTRACRGHVADPTFRLGVGTCPAAAFSRGLSTQRRGSPPAAGWDVHPESATAHMAPTVASACSRVMPGLSGQRADGADGVGQGGSPVERTIVGAGRAVSLVAEERQAGAGGRGAGKRQASASSEPPPYATRPGADPERNRTRPEGVEAGRLRSQPSRRRRRRSADPAAPGRGHAARPPARSGRSVRGRCP